MAGHAVVAHLAAASWPRPVQPDRPLCLERCLLEVAVRRTTGAPRSDRALRPLRQVWGGVHATGQFLSPAGRALSMSTVHGGAGGGAGLGLSAFVNDESRKAS